MLSADPAPWERSDPVMTALVAAVGPCLLPAAGSGRNVFETLARSIAGQQLTGAVAARILERLEGQCGGRFPRPEELRAMAPEVLRGVGFSFAKIAALHDLADRTLSGELPPDETLASLDDESVIGHCTTVRGVGRWTAEMLLMFHLGRPDVLPVGDFGVCNGFRLAYGLRGMPQPKALLAFGKRWQPCRSAAAWYLWRAVDLHREGRLPPRAGRAPRVAVLPPRSAR